MKIKEKPYLHDKIEFDLVYNCFTFDFVFLDIDNAKYINPKDKGGINNKS